MESDQTASPSRVLDRTPKTPNSILKKRRGSGVGFEAQRRRRVSFANENELTTVVTFIKDSSSDDHCQTTAEKTDAACRQSNLLTPVVERTNETTSHSFSFDRSGLIFEEITNVSDEAAPGLSGLLVDADDDCQQQGQRRRSSTGSHHHHQVTEDLAGWSDEPESDGAVGLSSLLDDFTDDTDRKPGAALKREDSAEHTDMHGVTAIAKATAYEQQEEHLLRLRRIGYEEDPMDNDDDTEWKKVLGPSVLEMLHNDTALTSHSSIRRQALGSVSKQAAASVVASMSRQELPMDPEETVGLLNSPPRMRHNPRAAEAVQPREHSDLPSAGGFSNDASHLVAQNDTGRLLAQNDTHHLPAQNDTSRLLAHNDTSHLLAHNDTSRLLAQNDTGHLLAHNDTSHLLGHSDTGRSLGQSDTNRLLSEDFPSTGGPRVSFGSPVLGGDDFYSRPAASAPLLTPVGKQGSEPSASPAAPKDDDLLQECTLADLPNSAERAVGEADLVADEPAVPPVQALYNVMNSNLDVNLQFGTTLQRGKSLGGQQWPTSVESYQHAVTLMAYDFPMHEVQNKILDDVKQLRAELQAEIKDREEQALSSAAYQRLWKMAPEERDQLLMQQYQAAEQLSRRFEKQVWHPLSLYKQCSMLQSSMESLQQLFQEREAPQLVAELSDLEARLASKTLMVSSQEAEQAAEEAHAAQMAHVAEECKAIEDAAQLALVQGDNTTGLGEQEQAEGTEITEEELQEAIQEYCCLRTAGASPSTAAEGQSLWFGKQQLLECRLEEDPSGSGVLLARGRVHEEKLGASGQRDIRPHITNIKRCLLTIFGADLQQYTISAVGGATYHVMQPLCSRLGLMARILDDLDDGVTAHPGLIHMNVEGGTHLHLQFMFPFPGRHIFTVTLPAEALLDCSVVERQLVVVAGVKADYKVSEAEIVQAVKAASASGVLSVRSICSSLLECMVRAGVCKPGQMA